MGFSVSFLTEYVRPAGQEVLVEEVSRSWTQSVAFGQVSKLKRKKTLNHLFSAANGPQAAPRCHFTESTALWHCMGLILGEDATIKADCFTATRLCLPKLTTFLNAMLHYNDERLAMFRIIEERQN